MARANGENFLKKGPSAQGSAPANSPEVANGTEPLPYGVQRRLEVVQRLQSYQGSAAYGAEKKRAAQELGVSDRSCRVSR